MLLALGFASYALWRFSEPFLEDGEDGVKKYGKWAAWIARGLIYAGLTYGTVKLIVDASAGQSQNAKAHKATAEVSRGREGPGWWASPVHASRQPASTTGIAA